jgi:membrane fusion protein, adhesin transport system
MLNISPNSIMDIVDKQKFSSFAVVDKRSTGKLLLRLLTVFTGITLIFMFLPWTQNIRADGNVIALKPEQRPQSIQSVIGGRIEKWYVQEGDYVVKGDTILFISEVKDQYFDPEILIRTTEQIDSKQSAVNSYGNKVIALESQIAALQESRVLKLQQAENKIIQARLKVISDSIDFQAAKINFEIAQSQLTRIEELYNAGLYSLVEFEGRKLKFQQENAKLISAENKLLTSRNELENAEVEISSIDASFRDAISKAQSDKFTAMSNMFDSEATTSKLQNDLQNYSIRRSLYYITAPQDGFITQVIESGIGETVKEGQRILTIMPSKYDLAVEMFIKPLDLPLLQKGQPVQIQFDGWPAIVFSGWPNTSYGTYTGNVLAMDNFANANGQYRVLVTPDPTSYPWPDALRVGAGATSMVLLKDVPIYYELWRNINGFPPDYYKPTPMLTQGQ